MTMQEKTDVILTTYGTVRADAAKLARMKFGTIVIDEAQVIKNASSQTSSGVWRVVRQCMR